MNLFGECMMPTCIMRNSFVVNLFEKLSQQFRLTAPCCDVC